MKRLNIILLLLITIPVLLLGIYGREALPYFLHTFFFDIIYALLTLAILLFATKLFLPNFYQKITKEKILRIIYFPIFLPLVIFPVFRCYFRIPYLFCHTCPSRCPWGWLRLYIIPTVLLINLDKRYWCHKLCPAGTIQDLQAKVVNKKIKLNKKWFYIGYLPLILLVIFYLLIFPEYSSSFYNYMLKGIYAFSLSIFITAILIFILAFFIPRFFCNMFCPVGRFSSFLLKIYGNKKS